jgi:hypothetical protein
MPESAPSATASCVSPNPTCAPPPPPQTLYREDNIDLSRRLEEAKDEAEGREARIADLEARLEEMTRRAEELRVRPERLPGSRKSLAMPAPLFMLSHLPAADIMHFIPRNTGAARPRSCAQRLPGGGEAQRGGARGAAM